MPAWGCHTLGVKRWRITVFHLNHLNLKLSVSLLFLSFPHVLSWFLVLNKDTICSKGDLFLTGFLPALAPPTTPTALTHLQMTQLQWHSYQTIMKQPTRKKSRPCAGVWPLPKYKENKRNDNRLKKTSKKNPPTVDCTLTGRGREGC